MSTWVWVLLSFFRRKRGYLQTCRPSSGVSTLLGVMGCAHAVTPRCEGGGNGPSMWDLTQLILVAAIVGRILKLAIEGSMLTAWR